MKANLLNYCFLSWAFVATAQLPFFEDFDQYDNDRDPAVTPDGFQESTGDVWFVQDAGFNKVYRHAETILNQSFFNIFREFRFASVTLPERSTGYLGITVNISVQLTDSDNFQNDIEVGITFNGIGPFNPGYKAAIDVLNSGFGTISLQRNGKLMSSGEFPAELVAGRNYEIEIVAEDNGKNGLYVEFVITDGAASASVSFVDDSPLTEDRFGFEDLILTYPGSSASLRVDYDNLRIVDKKPLLLPRFTSIRRIEGGELELTIEGLISGSSYELMVSDSIVEVEWQQNIRFEADGETAVLSQEIEEGSQFFRLLLLD